MNNDNQKKYHEALYEALRKHSPFPSFGILIGLSLGWVLILTTLSNTLNIDEALSSFSLSPTHIILLVGFLNIYFFANWLNRYWFRKKYISAAIQNGLTKTLVETYITKREIETLILRGDLHGNLKKNISRLRQEK